MYSRTDFIQELSYLSYIEFKCLVVISQSIMTIINSKSGFQSM